MTLTSHIMKLGYTVTLAGQVYTIQYRDSITVDGEAFGLLLDHDERTVAVTAQVTPDLLPWLLIEAMMAERQALLAARVAVIGSVD